MSGDVGEPATTGSTVLVVGCDDGTASLLETGVGEGRVASVPTVEAALDRIEEGTVSCVVSAYRLPDGNGVEFLSRVRETAPSMPFVLYAEEGDERVASEAIAAGVTDYVVAGADDDRVLGTVESALDDEDVDGPDDDRGGTDGVPGPSDGDWSAPDEADPGVVDWGTRWPHPAGLFAVQDDGFLSTNGRMASMFGYDPDELIGVDPTTLVDEEDRHHVADLLESPGGSEEGPSALPRRTEFTGLKTDGTRIDVECHAWRTPGPEDVVVGAALDVTGREGGERQLAALRDVMREMMETKDEDRIGELAVDVLVDVLDPLVATVSLYDGTAGSLRTAAAASGLVDLHDAGEMLVGDEGIAWDAFVKGEDLVVDDVSEYDGADPDSTVGSEMVIPLGDHGVMAVGAATANAFDEGDLRFVRTLATTVEMALDRADREETILERTDQLRQQNRQLDRLHRIDAIVRDIGSMLVRATDRDAIERGVCERLAEVDHWKFVWIGERPVTEPGITPREWAGGPERFLDTVVAESEDGAFTDAPAEWALETGKPQTRTNIVAISGADAWRTTALDHGFRAVTAIPLTYEHREYGVLEVYGDDPSMFGDEETEVLAELADMIAYALNAVEREQALFADAGPELAIAVPDDATDSFFPKLAASVEGEVGVDGIVPGGDGSYLTYLSVPGGSPGEIEEAASGLAAVERVRSIGGEDGDRFEVHLAESDLFETVAAHGASIRGLSASPGGTEIRIELPVTADIRAFVEAFESVYPGAEVTAQRSTFDADTATDVGASYTDLLTDRQREVLRVAYHSGFFEWPRESTGEDIAETLEVSPPTVHKHLRAAERKLLAAILGERGE